MTDKKGAGGGKGPARAAWAADGARLVEELVCIEAVEVCGVREFEPAELGPLQRRNGVKSADKEIHYLVRGTFGDGEAEDDKGINDTRWVALDELLALEEEDLEELLDNFETKLNARMKKKRGGERRKRQRAAERD